MTGDRAAALLRTLAKAEGFDVVGITGPDAIDTAPADLKAFLQAGHHGTMDWLSESAERRSDPRSLWPDVRSIVLFGLNYGPDGDPLATLADRKAATISVYARNRDYHDVIKGALKRIGSRFAAQAGAEIKVFVDTAPVMEKPLAAAAGLGWQGKHTNVVSRQLGSWLFLGAMFTSAELPADEKETDHCGSCRACLDICPTNAFPAPYRIDARRCISYLTIEHKGPIHRALRPLMGNRIYGCDDCLAVCPWNKYAQVASEAKLRARQDLMAPRLGDLARLDDGGFRKLFSGSPIKRIGRNRFIRNVLIAIGNSAEAGLISDILPHLDDADPLVRGGAVWALSQLADPATYADEARARAGSETDAGVAGEWAAGFGVAS
ncbi:MAG TPA: tRNA epoxyqueuosine(34) reductase QueG [Afifellaceae bacterium]|nr:tRNA epoxyqueuosine(34) reductase QueG [Afifellaceae bacterium]